MDALSDADQKTLMSFIMKQQLKETQTTFNSITEKCFTDCVSGFRGRSLDTTENKCMNNCAEKYFKSMNRAGLRFGEQNAAMQQQAMEAMQQQGQQN